MNQEIRDLKKELEGYKNLNRRVGGNYDHIYSTISLGLEFLENSKVVLLGGIEKTEKEITRLTNEVLGLTECPSCLGEGRIVTGQSHDCWGGMETDYSSCSRCKGTGLISLEKEKEERRSRFLVLKEEFE